MALKDDLKADVAAIFKEAWSVRDGTVVPAPEDLKLSNDVVRLNGTVLYADLAESTKLVDSKKAEFAAEIYKAYLRCAAKIISAEGGSITAYDGDRIMGVFIGYSKNTSAVRTAMKINWARLNIINPAIKQQYANEDYLVKHTIGVDTSKLFIARTGIRGSNDLVWVGRAANYAAKLSSMSSEYPSWITGTIYDNMHVSVKQTDGRNMWEERTWTSMGNMRIFRSKWYWPL